MTLNWQNSWPIVKLTVYVSLVERSGRAGVTSVQIKFLCTLFKELFHISPNSESDTSDVEPENSDDCILSVQNQPSTQVLKRRKTMRFCGLVSKQELLILLDSGSACTFISESVARQFQSAVKPCEELKFTTADGSPMVSAKIIPQFQWMIEGHTFTYDVRVLPLKSFDMIIGADWLEDHSPTWIHWKKKQMRFPLRGRRVVIHGLTDDLSSCKNINPSKFKGLVRRMAVAHCIELRRIPFPQATHPVSVRQVIQQYEHLFQEPTDLPPIREDDHHIPLIPGAHPVNIRPYRYSPQQKSEIEKQVAEMLQKGVIQHSSSPFASPVLLVKKKDGTWRFCVDYKHLNAIPVKNKHPLPVVDELLDELAGAQWFTKLDFRAGYHQIRVAGPDEYKTAFKTHSGLYEFRVMPFGLTNAPASFQGIMNKIFATLLRKCVLVFMDDILIYSSSLEDHALHLQQVLAILHTHQFHVKLSKCIFAKQLPEYLGHLITAAGVATEPSKIAAVSTWPPPTNLKQLRGFLGLTGYYTRFIRH